MKTNFAQQCQDSKSGKFGSFTFDEKQAKKDGFFTATSPVFLDTAEFFKWCSDNGIELEYHKPFNF